MPRTPKRERHVTAHFTWKLYQRNKVWYADGRSKSNKFDVKRNTLGTRDHDAAVRALPELDAAMAVKFGLAKPTTPATGDAPVPLAEGRRLYEEHVGRDRMLGGARASSAVRYKSVLDKFLPFAAEDGVRDWNGVTADLLTRYIARLKAREYARRTIRLEATTIIQVNKFLVEAGRLPAAGRVVLRLAKVRDSSAYCWREAEVRAILAACAVDPALRWLHDVLFTLAHTGLRINELTGLRWANIDSERKMINLRGEGGDNRRTEDGGPQTTKSGRGRSIPIHDDLRGVLAAIPLVDGGYVFRGPAGGPVSADTVRQVLVGKVLAPLARRFPTPAGEVGFIDGRLHTFRRYFCSRCASRGIPQNVVMKWLGHRDSAMVDYYFTLHDDVAREQMRKLGSGGAAGV